MESALWELAGEGAPDDEVSVIARLHEDSPPPPGLTIVARFGPIVTARIRRGDLSRVRGLVASMKRPQDYGPAPADEGEDEADEDLQPRPGDIRRGSGPPTGRGVVVAHLDWGFDFAHPAFRKADGRTRLLALWDQGCAYDPARPNRFGFGRIYLRDEIDRALAAPNPYRALGYRWWTSDRGNGSHGTHTFGISAGGGCEGLPPGLAPDADLVFVDLTTRSRQGPQPLGSSTDLLEGCAFADEIAGERPLVINTSLGRQAGQHDGLTLTEYALEHFVTCRAGRAIAMSCGNYYAKSAHAQLTILPGETRRLGLRLAPGSRKAELDLWYPRIDRLAFRLEGPEGLATGLVGPGDRDDLNHGGRPAARLYHRSDDPNNGDNQVSLYVYAAAPPGEWRLSIEGQSVGDGRIHAWVERDPAGASRLAFADPDVDPSATVGTICNGFSTIAVAAYDPHSGGREPGSFSSSGPTRDGRNSRPTLAAPGCKILSARSRPRDGAAAPAASRMSGTSMAAPHVAGAIALMYEAAPRPLWIDEVRALLVGTADPVPEASRPRLGAGYLDSAAAVAAARAVSPTPPPAWRRGSALAPRPQLRLPSAQESEMSEFDDAEQAEDAPFDCDADYEAEFEAEAEDADVAMAVIEGGFDESGREEFDAGEGEYGEYDEYGERSARRRGPARLPFQIQLPVGGGGGLGLAVPIGGRSSPLALSVPLGGGAPAPAAPAPQAPAAPAAAAPPQPAEEPPLTTLEPAPDPVAAGTEQGEYGEYGEYDERFRRGRGPAPLPFQIQLPVGGGGGLGLAVPIGGRSSPFALSVPLGGSAPAPAPAPAAPVAAAAPREDPPLTTALDLPADPIAAATEQAIESGELDGESGGACCGDCDAEAQAEDEAALAEALRIEQLERSFVPTDFSEVDARYAGEQLMAAVDAALEAAPESSADLLESLGEALGEGEGVEDGAAAPSLFELFRALSRGEAGPGRLCGRPVRVIARPGDSLSGVTPLRGDVLLRLLPAQRWVQLSFIAEPGVVAFDRLSDRALRPEGGAAGLPGRYVQVVEGWPVLRREEDGFARRIANAADLLPLDTMLLRMLPPGAEPNEAAAETEPSDPAAPDLASGARGPAVAALQRRLNLLHARRSAAGLPGLGDLPLAEDGVFGPRLRAAVEALQRFAPPGLVPAPTGIMDRAGWNALALLEAAAASLPATPRVARRAAAPSPAGAAAIAAGQETIDRVPLLAGHRGTPPDLVIRWNAMQATPERVDVVVHLHGFSGLGAAMRIDRHKLPASGLDFVNPANPAEAGRTAPTLALLPRGNFYGGASHSGYDFPALNAPGALDQLIATALARFAASIGAPRVEPGRLILTAHSGGGAALMRLLAFYDPQEIHAFDALYGRPDALIRWAEARLRGSEAATAALRVLFRDREGTAAHSRAVDEAVRRLIAGRPELERRFRIEATREAHNAIPRRYGWRLLADAGADLDSGDRPHGGAPRPDAADSYFELAEDDPAPGLTQAEVDALARCEFANSRELEAYFAAAGGFADWFNRELSGHRPFVRSGRGGALRVPTSDAARRRFAGFWDRPDLAYALPRISLLEFASLMAIVLNETDGDFAPVIESSGRGGGGRTDARGRHPGLAYFFDRIELRPGHWKASYNHLSGGRQAGDLFNDDVFIAAHGTLGGAARLARHGGDFGGAWNGNFYPQDQFSTDERDPETAFIREADFYKFRGRGIIQTTGRESYLRLVRHVRAYRGTDPVLSALARRWAPFTDQNACTASTNAEWAQLFALPEVLALAFSFHSGGPRGYRMMSRQADILNGVTGAPGSIYQMGRRISGSPAYGRGLYRDRVLAMLRAMLPVVSAGASPAAAPRDPAAAPHEQESPPPRRPREVPTPDADTLRAQWRANPRAHGYFQNREDVYLEFGAAFAQRGVADAAAYLADNITRLTFFGRHQPGHRDLAAPLSAAERTLAGQTVDPPIASFGCLNVRRIAGTNRLSFHALGKAIDLNPRSNPHIRSAADFLVIGAVTGVDLRGETSPARLQAASRQFQRDFNAGWIDAQTDPAIRAALAPADARRRLLGYARHGFCTLYVPLIEALIAAGLNWGGGWRTSKDFMHFELP
ncbi:MAG TPA: S8 family serine peptidase [Allosphingosinicella sp.]|nr:S8 family serine peptidase [Allosphingosinicella sp.]